MNPKLNIEQLADFLAGRAEPEVAGRLRRELSDPDASAAEMLVALDEVDNDPLLVDWSRLDEPRGEEHSALALASQATVAPPFMRHSFGRWARTVATGIAGGLAAVVFLTGIDGATGFDRRHSAPGVSTEPTRPARAVSCDAELAKAESLSPQPFAEAEALENDSLDSIALGETRLTGLQMREHLVAFSTNSP
jgi:hypothetical protein